MPWNPETYNQFKETRYKPFFDLSELIIPDGLEECVDLGCGTGEQTKILSEKFAKANFLGIDPSPEMLSKSKEYERANLHFENSTVEDFLVTKKPNSLDLIFSNAALQWSDDHPALFPRLISLLSDKGQFAVQMPMQKENLLNQLLITLAREKPFNDYLNGWKRESPLLTIDQYTQILFENGLHNIQVIQKVYPIIADGPGKLFEFISGSALIPYLERINANQQEHFITEFNSRIQKAYKQFPAIYAFKRLLLYGSKVKPG